MQVALYARVSTTRQAENDLSIPDQLRQMRLWAERLGHVVVKEYVEPGASAMDDKRPVFQTMVADATVKPAPYQAIIVHSLSRFFRDLVLAAMYERKLQKAGVSVISITQTMQNDPSGEMQRRMIMLFDEYQSKETAKHVLRGMQENARQGYFNGAKAPFGYETIEVGQTGAQGRIKKKLAIHEPEAEVVQEIYALYVYGKNDSPRMGMKEIANTLNRRGISMRGKPWRVQKIQQVLSAPTYVGSRLFNLMDNDQRKKPEAEWIKVPVPAIISRELYDQATKLRGTFTPLKCAPRRESSPNLLTGILKCSGCGATMVLTTGTSKTGACYRYYKCSNRVSKGNVVCKAPSLPQEPMDKLVMDALRNLILTPAYIRGVVDAYRQHMKKNGGKDGQRIKKLEAGLKEVELAETKLFEAVEKGALELNDRLKERAKQHQTRRDAITGELATLQSQQEKSVLQTITPQKVEAMSRVLSKHFQTPTPFSRAYLKATVRDIRSSGHSLILRGESGAMVKLIASGGNIESGGVRGFIPEWRRRRDSNP